MGRKKRGFDWVREDVEEEAREVPPRRDKGAEKRLRKRAEKLALHLMTQSVGVRRRLPIGEDTQEALDGLVASKPTPARRRLVLRVTTHLVEEDMDAIDAALAGDSDLHRAERAGERWRDRLAGGDKDALSAFLDAHPNADVQRLRQALRHATAEGAKGDKARRVIFEVVRDAVADAED